MYWKSSPAPDLHNFTQSHTHTYTLLILYVGSYRCCFTCHLFSWCKVTCSRPMIPERLYFLKIHLLQGIKRATKKIGFWGAKIPKQRELIAVTPPFYTVHFSLGPQLVFWFKRLRSQTKVTSKRLAKPLPIYWNKGEEKSSLGDPELVVQSSARRERRWVSPTFVGFNPFRAFEDLMKGLKARLIPFKNQSRVLCGLLIPARQRLEVRIPLKHPMTSAENPKGLYILRAGKNQKWTEAYVDRGDLADSRAACRG